MPGLRKKPSMDGLKISMDQHSKSLNQSFNLSDTGSFSKDNWIVGPNGITQSPLSFGEISSLRLDQVEQGALIGRGNSSRVYAATHKPSGKRLAVKVLQAELEGSRESRSMLLNEIKTVFNACSDHLVSFYDAFLKDGAIYLALEYMDCGSLEGLLKSASQSPALVVPEGVNACVIFQILQGLTYLHRERHSVHRDLKPANVLLDSSGFVKLSDFGISKELGSGTYAQAGTQVGTLAYMSPERVRGESYGFSSDVWSLGLIALEAALGAYPYPCHTNYFDLVRTIVDGPLPTETPEVQQRLPADLLGLVGACLCKNAHARPDVISLTRNAFLARHAASPVDLRAYLQTHTLGPPTAPAGMAGSSGHGVSMDVSVQSYSGMGSNEVG
jgi:serine/threonine protein kinase